MFIDNFESYNSVGDDMSGKGGWVVSNGTPATMSDGPVVIVDSYIWDGSTRSASVGGIEPTNAALTTLSHSLNNVYLGGTVSNPSSFKFETAYTESDANFPNRNNFSFVLTASSGNLLTIDLAPAGTGQYSATWSSDFASGALFGLLTKNTSTQFQLDTWWNGSAMAYSFTNALNGVSSGTFSSGVGQSDTLTSFAVNWDSTTGGGFGNNYITVDNVSLVPEPSSSLLICLAGLGFISRRRRA